MPPPTTPTATKNLLGLDGSGANLDWLNVVASLYCKGNGFLARGWINIKNIDILLGYAAGFFGNARATKIVFEKSKEASPAAFLATAATDFFCRLVILFLF